MIRTRAILYVSAAVSVFACTSEPEPEDIERAMVEVEAAGDVFAVREGGTLTLRVTLAAQPVEDVLIPLSVDDDELELSERSLTFSVLNWNLPQEVSLSNDDDFEADGDKPVVLSLGPPNSLDACFNQTPALELTIVSVDGVCGNGVVDGDEACDESEPEDRRCGYGERSCVYCTGFCQEAPGAVTGFCGDGVIQEEEGGEL